MYETLLKTVTNLGSPKVLLLGDFMLDIYVYGDALRISPEAPVPVLRVTETQYKCGGAGSVAADLAALKAEPICLGTVGTDRDGTILKDLLGELGVDTSHLLALADRPTISKQRLVGLAQHRHRQQLMRIDHESDGLLTKTDSDKLLGLYSRALEKCDIVCLQDYNKGIFSDDFCQKAIKLAKNAGKKVLIDPGRIDNYQKYAGACAITPNRTEASMATGIEINNPDDAAAAAAELANRLDLEAVVITLDKEGAYLKTDQISKLLSTHPRSVYDVTGAGDMVLSALAITLAAGCDYETAVNIANIAGGIEVEKFGAATVSIEEIVNEIVGQNRGKSGKIRSADDLAHELNWHRAQNDTIVFTNGCFDVLHRGHIEFLQFCKSHGDILVLGLNSDNSVKQLKGPERPINNQYDRSAVLAAMESVDYVVVFDELDPLELIKKVRPDVLVKGTDWAEKGVIGREFVEENGGKVVLAPLVKGKSSTATINKMKELNDLT